MLDILSFPKALFLIHAYLFSYKKEYLGPVSLRFLKIVFKNNCLRMGF